MLDRRIPLTQHVYNIDVVQTVAVGAASAQSTALTSDQVLLVSTVDCYVAVGASPTATATSFYLPAKTPIAITAGAGNLVAALQVSGAGTLFITEIN